MKTNTLIIAAISGFVATGAMAQVSTFDRLDTAAASDVVDDIEESITDAADRELSAFGNEGREVGSYGSVSLRATADKISGVESSDVSVGLRYGTFDGVNGIDATAAFTYGTDEAVETTNKLQAGVDYRRDFNDTLFAYVKADLYFNKLADDAVLAAGESRDSSQDIFVGAGLGYRIFNDASTQWSLQAGPGYRWNTVSGVETNEAAASVSSNFFKSLTETSYVTNDTDVIYSETSTTLTNELALSVSLTDTLSLRTSYATKFDDASDASFSDADNTLGVSVVYNFN
jgi:putative salt-induced outer membrane protein